MDIINVVIKRYTDFSLFELCLFGLFGYGLYLFIQAPTILPFLNSASTNQKDLSSFPLIVFFIIFWFASFLLLKRVMLAIYKFILTFKVYEFKSIDWPKDWEYQGNVRLWDQEPNCLYVTDSQSGCILKNHYWKNLEINFSCKFLSDGDDETIGIIFRAKSLSDYLMVQINNKIKKIVPHIRMEGRWETARLSTYKISTTFEKDVYFDVKLRVFNQKVELSINGNKELEWNIPTHSDIPLGNNNKNFEDTIVPKIGIRKSYGRIGFRAFQGEHAIIKNLTIKRLASII